MLIVNPFATATTAAGRDALVHTLESRFKVDVEHTTHRGHASELGARAVAEGHDAVLGQRASDLGDEPLRVDREPIVVGAVRLGAGIAKN